MWFVAVGASEDPCVWSFAGWTPFSEPETKAVADFILAVESRVQLYLSLHSYGQLWMTPWGYTKHLPDDFMKLVG